MLPQALAPVGSGLRNRLDWFVEVHLTDWFDRSGVNSPTPALP